MFAYGGVWNGFHWWWIIPIAMMILCFIMMRGHRGCLVGRSRSHHIAESAREILDKRYALGKISKEEYEEKKREISQKKWVKDRSNLVRGSKQELLRQATLGFSAIWLRNLCC